MPPRGPGPEGKMGITGVQPVTSLKLNYSCWSHRCTWGPRGGVGNPNPKFEGRSEIQILKSEGRSEIWGSEILNICTWKLGKNTVFLGGNSKQCGSRASNSDTLIHQFQFTWSHVEFCEKFIFVLIIQSVERASFWRIWIYPLLSIVLTYFWITVHPPPSVVISHRTSNESLPAGWIK